MDTGTGHVVVIHAWQDRYAHYTNYFDHAARAVTYVTTEIGKVGVPTEAAQVVVLENTADYDKLDAAVAGLVERFGVPEGIVALKESDLPGAMRLRAKYRTPGRRVEEQIQFLDKHKMLEAVSALGLALPRYTLAHSADEVLAFADVAGWPVVTKKLSGSASQGVSRLDGPPDLGRLRIDGPMVLQEHRRHPIIHVDGFSTGKRLGPWRANRYLGSCLAFTTGEPLGSVEIDDPEVLEVVGRFTETLLTGLSDKPRVFHLELFLHQDDNGNWQCEFLEVGARAGGGEISFVWREVHGIDLMGTEAALQMGHTPDFPAFGPDEPVGAFLMVPVPARRPCRVSESTSLVGVDGPYVEKLTPVGDVIPAGGSFYEHIGGRFRFRGTSSLELEQAVLRAAKEFRIVCEPA
ncbi:acetyl-CoA carboxylase biotin carboxylase subunit family protein [Streptomyces sp. NPDC058623]|uniref:ATP-grasp domain-containing protein n=1 Tax=Streptomyces sp. NPDC058623 TaxID=3346563 RepID=UPI00366003BA